MKTLLKLACALVCMLQLALPVQAADLIKVPTAWLDEHETFLVWYAKEKGWDKEAGLDVEMKLFSSGPDILTALPAGEWVFGAVGALPAMLGNLRHGISIIAYANNEDVDCTSVVVREDNPIAQVKGWNKDYPEVYGSPETVRGKTFLVTTLTSSHFALSSWLNVLGLQDKDVVIKNMDQAQALGAFENNIGDGVAIWAPYTFIIKEKGGVVFAGDIVKCGKSNPIVLIADTKYLDEHPDVAVKFLAMYQRSVDMLRSTTPEAILDEYLRFYLEFVGKPYNRSQALMDLKTHPVYSLDEQLAIFDDSKGPSQAQLHQTEVARFFSSVGRISPEEAAKVEDGRYATGKYLRLLKEQQDAAK